MHILALVFLPIALAWLPIISQRMSRDTCLRVSLLPVLVVIYLLLQALPAVLAGETLYDSSAWIPSLGLNLSFRIDGLSFLFASLISVIGLFVLWYARFYLDKKDSLGRLNALLLMFMTAMLGIVLSDNLLLLVLFWELTSLTSFLLIGYWQNNSDARKGARMALVVTGGGGLALLAGVILIGQIVGSFQLDDIFAAREVLTAHALYPTTLILILLGVFTKSAQFPFYFWLPHAMAAPTPVSAYLHSATMVKAGIFLLARLFPALGGTELWIILVSLTGLITMTFAAAVAMAQDDLKGLLAYSTVSHLGLITFLFGISTELAVFAGIFHIFNHAAFKASLFMIAGAVDHGTGTRKLSILRGLYKFMPLTAALSMIAAASMAGFPLLNGFLSKEMMLTESFNLTVFGQGAWLVPATATVAAVFSVFYSIRFAHGVFFNGVKQSTPIHPVIAPSIWMMLPAILMVVLCIAVGLFADGLVGLFLNQVQNSVLGKPAPYYEISIWHGVNVPLLLSIVALMGGLVLYQYRARLLKVYQKRTALNEHYIFEGSIQKVASFAGYITTGLENGSAQRYILYILVLFIAMIAIPLTDLTHLIGSRGLLELDFIASIASVILVLATLGTVYFYQSRFIALLIMGAVGLMIVILFARFSAPDLALTQLSVEAVTIVLLMLALYFLPSSPNEKLSKRALSRDIVIAIAVALVVGLLAFAILTRPFETISGYYLANAKPLGGGDNVVNVILVDFRGFDTFGEITVLAIAGLGIANMLKKLYLPMPLTDSEGRAWSVEPHPTIVSMMARILLPLALMVSIYILLRGHNAPGGGFIAGLVTSVALILQYVASGVTYVQERMRFEYPRWLAFGLLLAGLTGMGSWVVGYPFLTSTLQEVYLPVIGGVELSSALPFDLGVYFTVVATTLLILAYVGQLTTTERVDS